MSPLLLVMLGGAVGAPARYLTDRAVSSRHESVFPWGTFTVNMVGSFLLGLLTAVASPELRVLLGAGFCGALTTYSTFSYESLRLVEDGAGRFALANLAGSAVVGVAAAAAGVALGQILLDTAR